MSTLWAIMESVEFEIERDYPEQFAKKRRFSIRKSIIFFSDDDYLLLIYQWDFSRFSMELGIHYYSSTLYLTISAILGSTCEKEILRAKYFNTGLIGISALSIIIDYFSVGRSVRCIMISAGVNGWNNYNYCHDSS